VPYLILMWTHNEGAQPLIAPMDSADAITDQIYAWLKIQGYGTAPSHDGDNVKGWYLNTKGPAISRKLNEFFRPDQHWSHPMITEYDNLFFDTLCVQPRWIEYGK